MYIGDVVDRFLSGDNRLGSFGFGARSSGHPWLSLGAFGAGLLVGSALGLLFAPKPGSELRREVRQRAHDLGGNTGGAEEHPRDDRVARPS